MKMTVFSKKSIAAKLIAIGIVGVPGLGCGGAVDKYQPDNVSEYGVVTIGDSYFDWNGFIPEYLHDLAGVVYDDASVSGAGIGAITDQYNTIIATEHTVQTIIINGGANDLDMCTESNIADHPNGPGWTACKDAIAVVGNEIGTLLDSMSAKVAADDLAGIDGLTTVIWAGRYYPAPDKGGKDAIDELNRVTKNECDINDSFCIYVDTRALWDSTFATTNDNPDSALNPIQPDGKHLTELVGAPPIGDLLWCALTGNDNVYYRDASILEPPVEAKTEWCADNSNQ